MTYTKKSGNIENKIDMKSKYNWEIKDGDKTKYFNGTKTYNGAVEEELKEIFGEENVRLIPSDEKEKIILQEEMKNEKLLELYQKTQDGTATAETFEKAIKEQCLTCEVIKLIVNYYKDDVKVNFGYEWVV